MGCEKLYLEIDETGAFSDKVLLQPGVTTVQEFGTKLDKHVRIVLHEVDLVCDAQVTVEFKIGTTTVFKRSLAQNGEIHALDRDISDVGDSGVHKPLRMSISGTPNVTGFIRWSFVWAGGSVAKKAQDTYGV